MKKLLFSLITIFFTAIGFGMAWLIGQHQSSSAWDFAVLIIVITAYCTAQQLRIIWRR